LEAACDVRIFPIEADVRCWIGEAVLDILLPLNLIRRPRFHELLTSSYCFDSISYSAGIAAGVRRHLLHLRALDRRDYIAHPMLLKFNTGLTMT